MTPDEAVTSHPVCRLALQLARRLTGQPVKHPLLALLIAHLESLPREQLERNHREELLQRAYWMQAEASALMTALQLVTDYETAQNQVGDSRPGEEYKELKPHLDELALHLRRSKSPREAAQVLEENLLSSLKQRNESFAPRGF